MIIEKTEMTFDNSANDNINDFGKKSRILIAHVSEFILVKEIL